MSTARILLLSAVVASSALAAPAFADKPGDTDTTKTSKDTVTRTCSGGTVTLNGPLALFPPNHKMVDETFTATSTKDGAGMTTLMLAAATVSDISGGDGSPNEGPDSTGATTATGDTTATTTYQVRAERSGKGDGRTYTINFVATFKDNSRCSSTDAMTEAQQAPFTIYVPHDQGQGNNA